MTDFVTIDGSKGEGGGQILRSALALSIITQKPFRVQNIRAGRKKPGLLRQHLTAVKAAGTIGGAEMIGAELRSNELQFSPNGIHPGTYRFAVGSAGSANLVLQAVLPALLCADGPSELTLEGGTHNMKSPPFDFIARVFAPLIARMGAHITMKLERPGYYPAGGGKMKVSIKPCPKWTPIELMHPGGVIRRGARAVVAQLPPKIGQRELEVVQKQLKWKPNECKLEIDKKSIGPGNVLMLEIEREHVTELVTGFGTRGVRAETVAAQAVEEFRRYVASRVPVGEHLADQLLIPCALAGEGVFRTVEPTEHTLTNATIIQKFLDVDISFENTSRADTIVRVKSN